MEDRGFYLTLQAVRRQLAAMPYELYLIRLIHHPTRKAFPGERLWTAFQIQGLELDWICVTWDADLRLKGNDWRFHAFRGITWTTIHKKDRKRYLLNAYRVLLTRARQGMVIFVPEGDISDPTRDPGFYDDTYEYLASLGIEPT